MELVHKVQLTAAKRHERNHDVAIMVGYAVFAILLLAAIYFASGEPGTAPADFVNMSVFP